MPGPTGSHMPAVPSRTSWSRLRRDRFLELGAVVGVGVPAEAVHHHEEDLRVGGLDQRREVHALNASFPAFAGFGGAQRIANTTVACTERTWLPGITGVLAAFSAASAA